MRQEKRVTAKKKIKISMISFAVTVAVGSICVYCVKNIADAPVVEHTEDPSVIEHITDTPFITEQSNRKIKTGEKVNIGTYNLLSSSVPGYPLNINDDIGQKNNRPNIKINIETDNGTLISWNSETGEVRDKGKNISSDSCENIYWSPLCGKTISKKANINIVMYENNKIIEETLLYIYEEQEANYVIQKVI